MSEDACGSLDRKLAFLSRPDSYDEGTRAVETIETHMSYVFLTERYAYKMKKPLRDAFRDLTSLAARRATCETEVRLNRRLARHVYLGVAALVVRDHGLALGGAGEPVEWLIRMLRLPRHLMLDAALRENRLTPSEILRTVRTLAAFYALCERLPMPAAEYIARLARRIEDARGVLTNPAYGLDPALVADTARAQLQSISALAAALAARAPRLVEGHGDLRPEHVCLSQPPVFIDCLEFSRELRIVDPADEIGYLAMECAFLGAADAGRRIVDAYRRAADDAIDEALLRLYQSCRALTRAGLAAVHLDDVVVNGGRVRWIGQARAYLELAAALVLSPPAGRAPSRARSSA